MKKKRFIIIFILAGLLSGCNDYLNRENLDTFASDNFWKSETNLRLYTQQFYTTYFPGYGQLFTYGPVFSWADWADDQVSSSQWTSNVATSGNGWSFTNVRSHNLLINRANLTPVSDEAKNHWIGIGRFFRALEYSNLCAYFGDVPWFDKELFPTDQQDLYKPRDPLATVLKNVLADFEFAAANVRISDGTGQINRYVVLGFMSRKMLYFGTYLKYHNGDQELARTLLQKAAWAADQVISSGKYAVSDNYRALFTSEDLSTNKEVILYREYETAKVTHAILSYNNTEGQTGMTKNAYDSYLAADGFPIKQSPLYNYSGDNGRRNFRNTYANRDPRLYGTVVDSLRLNKVDAAPSTTGISSWKFLPEVITTETKFTSSFNVTDCPILRYGEVLMNYIEAVAELGTITQADLDKTINVLHNRSIRYNGKGTGAVAPKLPPVQLSGSNLTVKGVMLDDPDRDQTVSSLLWEIRRERRAELMFEGFRKDDLNRWRKFSYLMTNQAKNGGIPTDLAIGAYVDTLEYPRVTKAAKWKTLIKNKDIRMYYPNPSDQGKGYILVLYDVTQQRDWVEDQSFFERQYLRSIPLDQITMYKDMGVTLTQNPGWE